MQIDTSVCLVFILEKNAHVQFFSVSSTTGVKNILQTNQMQQHLLMVLWTGLKKKEKKRGKKSLSPPPPYVFDIFFLEKWRQTRTQRSKIKFFLKPDLKDWMKSEHNNSLGFFCYFLWPRRWFNYLNTQSLKLKGSFIIDSF